MRKTALSIISVLLASVIVFSTLSCAFADDGLNVDCPYIFIHGFMAKDILADKNDPDSEVIWPPTSDKITALVEECLPALVRFLADRNYEALGDAIIEPCKEVLCSADLDVNGEASDGSGVYFVYPDKSSINKTSQLDFNYDWRLDPVEIASQLNDFIDYVLDASECSQVVVECHSFGGIVTEAYTQLYGSSKLRSVCYNTTAIYGETYTGEMMSGSITFEGEAIINYLKTTLKDSDYSYILNDVFDVLNEAGIADDVADIGNGLVEYLGEEIIGEILLPMFAGWLSIWAMIPDNYIDSAFDYVFNQMYGDGGASHPGLYEKISNYNSVVRPFKTQTLKSQNEVTNVYVYSRYGFYAVPLTESWKNMCDSVIDTKYSSMGASCCDNGSRFSNSFIAKHQDDKYLNADGTIYSANALFADQTWFVKNLAHAKMPDSLDNLTYKLLYYNGQATVDTFEDYPQYLIYDKNTEDITAEGGTAQIKETEEVTFFDRLFIKIKTFFSRIADLFKLIREVSNNG